MYYTLIHVKEHDITSTANQLIHSTLHSIVPKYTCMLNCSTLLYGINYDPFRTYIARLPK